MSPVYMTTDEVAQQLRRSREWVQERCHRGDIRAAKLGDSWRITQAAVDEFMADAQPLPAPMRRSRRRRGAAA